jgi:hypothetical protein
MSTQPVTTDLNEDETSPAEATDINGPIGPIGPIVPIIHLPPVDGGATALTDANPTISSTASSVAVTVPNTSGTVTFQLIVTDNLGTQSVAATATVEIQGAPTAVLTATPTVVGAGETITLSGAGSTAVPPGSIANYTYTMEQPPIQVDHQVDTPPENN